MFVGLPSAYAQYTLSKCQTFLGYVDIKKLLRIAMLEHITGRLDSLRNTLLTLSKRKSFKYGLPFILFVVGGSFGLREWTQIRYQFSQVKGVSKEEAEKMGLHREKTVTLENTYEEIQKLDIDNWENKRGPRPWETPEQQTKK